MMVRFLTTPGQLDTLSVNYHSDGSLRHKHTLQWTKKYNFINLAFLIQMPSIVLLDYSPFYLSRLSSIESKLIHSLDIEKKLNFRFVHLGCKFKTEIAMYSE